MSIRIRTRRRGFGVIFSCTLPFSKGLVPFILDLVHNPDDKLAIRFLYADNGIGRPFFAPSGLPPNRLKMLRDAFDATMKDPDFLADAKKQGLEVQPESGVELAALRDKIYTTPNRSSRRSAS